MTVSDIPQFVLPDWVRKSFDFDVFISELHL